jgi:cyclophilin family peptidyl-prolyl cis-trans isomerase
MKKTALILFAVGLGFVWQASAQTPAQQPAKPSGTAKAGAGSSTKTGAAARSPYDRALLKPELLKAKAPETFDVKFVTTKGDFTVTVTRQWAPLGADRFYNLVRHHFYDNATFFRVLPGFVVQFGLNAHPAVSSAWTNAAIKDDSVAQSNKKGYITFATGGPNTRTTQVFINLADNARLDSMGFSPFGQVTDGLSVVESLYGGYGEGAPSGAGPKQDVIEARGKAYLDADFPKLDSIKSASLVGGAATTTPVKKPAAPAAKPAAKPEGAQQKQ